MNPLLVCVVIFAVVAVLTWAVTARRGSSAWLDRLWSILPIVYAWVFAGAAGLGDARLNLLAVLATAWGVRLTFNYARKGGFRRGAEDYRWGTVRQKLTPAQWVVFHALFISVYQQALLLLLILPAWTAYEHRTPLGVLDWILAAIFMLLLVGEGTADGQQWRFQQRKHAAATAGKPLTEGFISTGLFRYSRHPNLFCEILMWWVFYAIGAAAVGPLLSWTIIGTVLLTAQSFGSTVMAESLSGAKYPAYAAYRARTSRLVPWPPRA
ncbi:DUF1295 domain-containing protein [Mycetocola tolaasinivorans]|uniref:DUF1295 domain-containing protein n=1 Tax=Mycetocola tolaasinivorans TaxID=76635 RepID=A0A3L7AAT3_9MICO|nr:DUF1295 domain-containing protein [Mycetocola tolaasinivorans]